MVWFIVYRIAYEPLNGKVIRGMFCHDIASKLGLLYEISKEIPGSYCKSGCNRNIITQLRRKNKCINLIDCLKAIKLHKLAFHVLREMHKVIKRNPFSTRRSIIDFIGYDSDEDIITMGSSLLEGQLLTPDKRIYHILPYDIRFIKRKIYDILLTIDYGPGLNNISLYPIRCIKFLLKLVDYLPYITSECSLGFIKEYIVKKKTQGAHYATYATVLSNYFMPS